ncbi:hypothetical protein, partial [Pseudomonas aeruginosa]
GGEVTALEPVAALADLGREAARDFAPEIRWLDGALPDGAAAHAPYDVLLVEGALRAMPEALAALLPQK